LYNAGIEERKEKPRMSVFYELLAQKADLDRQIEEARLREFEAAAAQCRELIELFDLTPQDVGFVRTQVLAARKVKQAEKTFHPAKVRTSPLPALYRDPATGNTWTGRGPTPQWLKGHKDDFLIRDAT
jgi:DNA-binding protein H-NS